jgi:orotidine-5'-phosphate decarboxylase
VCIVKNRIIVALDTDSPSAALETARTLKGEVGMFKIGMELFPLGGADLIRKIQDYGADVFLDLKFHDIPNTVAGAIRSAVSLGVRFVTVHASGGRAMLEAAAKAAEGSLTTILAVTVLTSLDDNDLKEVGYSTGTRETVLRLAKMAREAGIGGLVCSAQEVAEVRSVVHNGTVLVTPGVRLPEDAVGDQKRVVTPEEAVKRGSDFLVIGRPITQAADPVQAARKFAKRMLAGC